MTAPAIIGSGEEVRRVAESAISRDELARIIVRSRGGEMTASDDWWPGAVAFHYEMCAKHPGFENGRSLVTDAFRTADAVRDHLLASERGAEEERDG